jgi:hypothetical protein
MSDEGQARPTRALFRDEAIAHHARASRAGRVLPLSPRSLALPFWALVAVVALAVTALFTVPADERTRGEARVSAGPIVTVFFPVAVATELRPNMNIDMRGAGGRRLVARLDHVGEAVTAASVTEALGRRSLNPALTAAVAVTAHLSDPRPTAGLYQAEVVLRRRPIAKLLVPGFRSLIGRRG